MLNTPAALNTPVAYALQHADPRWTTVNGMSTALLYATAEIERNRQRIAGITDVSCLQRFGVKGPNAAAWLQKQNLVVLAHTNSWLLAGADEAASSINTQSSLVLRLGSSEFLIEDQLKGVTYPVLSSVAGAHPIAAGVYKVQRNDAAFILSGTEMVNVLSELCMLDLRDKSFAADSVLMTQLAGISVTLIRQQLTTGQSNEKDAEQNTKKEKQQVYRLWCDGSYGPYLWETLTQIAAELGGGPVGLAHYA